VRKKKYGCRWIKVNNEILAFIVGLFICKIHAIVQVDGVT
jgi:hypothetical protein